MNGVAFSDLGGLGLWDIGGWLQRTSGIDHGILRTLGGKVTATVHVPGHDLVNRKHP